jgi:catechol 2,3-dioxygenase-like lactoylglutathione lyase family enzyme
MDLRVDIITLAVPDLDEAHDFYVNRLGWHPALVIPGEVTFLRAGPGRMVGLFGRRDLERDVGDRERVPPFDLGQLFNTPAEVDTAVEAMAAAGGKVRKPPQRPEFFEGYHAYVEAPDGTVWELVYNPGFHFDSEGAPHFGPPGG